MIRVAILGTGGMGQAHARAFQSILGCKISACCDIDADRAAAFAKQFRIPQVYTDYRKLLADATIDAVSIPMPDALHASVYSVRLAHVFASRW